MGGMETVSLRREDFRSDIVLGETALRLAVDSYGREGAPNGEAVVSRAAVIYAWLIRERK